MVSLDEHVQLSPAQRKAINKPELKRIIDEHLALLNNDPNAIRNVITDAVNAAIDTKFDQLELVKKN